MSENIILIPTYNEIENIGIIVNEILSTYNEFDILIIDDNSTDGTKELVNELAHKHDGRVMVLNREKKEGLGVAYRAGMKIALAKNYKFILQMDADLSHQPQYLKNFLEAAKGADLVVGSRYLNGISIVNWPLRRLILSLWANKYVRFFTGLKLTDFTSGFRCFRSELLNKIPLDHMFSDGYAFLVELTYRSFHLNAKISEIPIVFVERRNGESKINYTVCLEAAVIPLKLRLKKLLGTL